MGRGVALGLVLGWLLSGGGPVLAEPPTRQALHARQEISVPEGDVQAWIAAFRPRALEAGISQATLDAALSGVALRPDVVEKDRNQTEFTRTIWDYLDKAVSDDRVAAGQKALKKHGALLRRIEAKYDVDRQILLAIWGLESSYGVVRGDVPTVAALVTLASSTRRGAYFERELLAALRILQEGDVAPAAMQGSWAGAMGHTQFMPSSYLSLAVDFDGDGRRDIWSEDPTDALASTAAFLARWGWRKGEPWGVEITLPEGFDYRLAGEKIHHSAAEWQAMGVARTTGGALPDCGPASVLLPGGARGAAFLICPNFHVIEHYNPADAYVIAVGHLGDRILGGGPILGQWPRDLRALTLDERIALQHRLTLAGFDAGGADGRIGPLTQSAIRGFQTSIGVVPDGYASLDVLNRLP
ncbi:lytic murein transglycosylase [bacterium]|nr:lytic murein transglycosylase [bacterium]